MTEDEMKTKECRAPSVANYIDGQDNYIWPKCSASACAMWEPEYDEESREIRGSAKVPEGWVGMPKVGLLPEYQTIKRWVPNNKGDCGFKTKESGCFYSR